MSEATNVTRVDRLARLVAWSFLGGLIGMISLFAAWRVTVGRTAVPPLTAMKWRQSREQWRRIGIRNYDLEVAVQGRQAAVYAVQIRDGEPQRATRDGQPLPQRRTWATWSVEGMFETIARDLEAMERYAAGRADPSTPQLKLRAAFHPEWGYPQKYVRTEVVRVGANPEVSWEVIRFSRSPAGDNSIAVER